jgi:hypothetical protein
MNPVNMDSGINFKFKNLTNKFNENKYFIGSAMILFNLGSKYITMDMGKSHEVFLKSPITRRITIFCMFFVATRDVFVSAVMTLIFMVVILGFFNEKSSISMIPASLFDDVVTDEELKLANDLIEKHKKQKQ